MAAKRQVGDLNGMAWAMFPSTVSLAAGATYYLVSSEEVGIFVTFEFYANNAWVSRLGAICTIRRTRRFKHGPAC